MVTWMAIVILGLCAAWVREYARGVRVRTELAASEARLNAALGRLAEAEHRLEEASALYPLLEMFHDLPGLTDPGTIETDDLGLEKRFEDLGIVHHETALDGHEPEEEHGTVEASCTKAAP